MTSPRHNASSPPTRPSSRSLSLPSSPQLTPLASSMNLLDVRTRRLLVPTVRVPRTPMTLTGNIGDGHSTGASPRRHKHSASKRIRSRSGSTSLQSPSDPFPVTEYAGEIWLGPKSKFDIVQEQLEVEGYQLYVVEKWIVERRPITVLTVFTGNPEHKITVTALSPNAPLTLSAAQSEWDRVLHDLRRDGARPKETPYGTLMVTSLANFRSDFTIVHIPGGNFLDIQEQLYTNINLLRMGCSGRSALTLEEPSDTTKDRFVSMYHFPTKIRSAPLFNPTVLELVKFIQAGLAVCNMFDSIQTEGRERANRCRDIDGLLCEDTAEGIARWVSEIGEAVVGVEPMERLADPTVVSALLSLILTVRNKLRAVGLSHVVPKDPFLDPYGFAAALAHFQFNGRGHHLSNTSLTSTPNLSTPSYANSSSINTSVNGSGSPHSISYLTRPLIKAISQSYDKLRQSDSYKVHRVLLNKLDDLTTDLRSATSGDAHLPVDTGSQGGWAVNPTLDMAHFVRGVVSGDKKDGISSLRLLWTGRVTVLQERRRPSEPAGASIGSEGEDRERGEKTDGRSSDSDGERFIPPWGGKVQKTWAAFSRKRHSADLSKVKSEQFSSPSSSKGPALQVPELVISGDTADDEEILSSGQVSPTPDGLSNLSFLTVGQLPRTDTSSTSNVSTSDYERRITEFNQKRPSTKPYYQSRIVSWSDPLSARGILDEDDQISGKESGKESGDESGKDSKRQERRRRREATGPSLGRRLTRVSEHGEFLVEASLDDLDVAQTKSSPAIRRSRSFDETMPPHGIRVLPLDRMRIDVELCGQLLIMRRRERHLRNVLDCLQVITQSLSDTNAHLREDHQSHLPALRDIEARTQVIADIESERTKIDAMEQETLALSYESEQFRVPELWYMAFPPRRKVLQLREKVFGTGGRRLPPGEHGAHGRFNRLQWTLDGRERLVDAYGRTESEAEEEEALPDDYGLNPPYEEEDVVAHQGMRPTWLLQLFNRWGSQWGLFTAKTKDKGKEKEVKEQSSVDGSDAGPVARSRSDSDQSTSPDS